ncbi:Lethal(2) giant larvae -like protein 1 [Trichinella sp. T9]|nr:Lethal(2) giant larvae -like protein 1 [Trichinella sp. T9]
MDLLKYLKSKIPVSPSHEAKERSNDEYFRFRKTFRIGFPQKVTSLFCDEEANFVGIGTKFGMVKILGSGGIDFVNEIPNQLAITQLFYVKRSHRVVAVCADQSFHLFEVNFRDGCRYLDYIKVCSSTGKLKQISCCCLCIRKNDDECVLIGTESGNVYSLNVLSTFEITDCVIYQEMVLPKIPDDYKLNPGAVEALSVHPHYSDLVLIGYNRGLIALWDFGQTTIVRTFVASHQVQWLCWHDEDRSRFVSSHSDGSYSFWKVDVDQGRTSFPDSRSPFGPFPCKAITKILWRHSCRHGDDYLFFAGGMPRAACSDRNALSVQLNTHQVVFDFTSRVVDFCLFDEPVLDKGDTVKKDVKNYNKMFQEGRGEPKLLLVLCEEELVGIDLTVDGWPCVRVPYFNAFHASPVTTCCHVNDLVRDCFDEICQYGLRQSLTTFALSDTPWPGYESSSSVLAKFPDNELANNPCLLITGHEDGTVKIWNVSWMDSPLLFVLNTACLYDSYQDPSDYSDDENVWPPFRKVGLYDPFSDDARFAVHRVCMDRNTGTVMVGGAAGQVTVWNLESEDKKHINIDCIDVNLVDGTEHFEWKGHASLKIRMDGMQFLAGYQPSVVIQCYPPASITACAASYAWSLITFGTAHGFAVFDCTSMRIIYKRCTLTPSEITPALTVSEGTISRYKSFKKSLRESFRRKRKPRSNRTSDCQSNKPKQRDNAEASTNSQRSYYHHHQLSRQAAVERAIEARSENKQQLNSLVRCATFASVNLVSGGYFIYFTSPTLWIGTNGGMIFAYLLKLPPNFQEEVSCVLAKEIRLRHAAPVLALYFTDYSASSSHGRLKLQQNPSSTEMQKLIVCSEEQIKSFSLPSLKSLRQKYRLTALEGSRILKTQLVTLTSKSNHSQRQSFVIVLTNQGTVDAFDSSTLKMALSVKCMDSNSISAILSTVLTEDGEGFYMLSSSEWQRFCIKWENRFCWSHANISPIGDAAFGQPSPDREGSLNSCPEDSGDSARIEQQQHETEAAAEEEEEIESLQTASPLDVTADSIHDCMPCE